MAANRRNYYRLLHVQADAPADVIKAAYRALIRVHHPDAGGDQQIAALLNEAYGVLSEPTSRAAYDVKRALRSSRPTSGAPRNAHDTPHHANRPGCPFCRLSLPSIVGADTRCLRCQSPLSAPPRDGRHAKDSERRSLPRISKSDWGVLRTSWPGEPIDVRMRDLSLDGISIYAGTALPVGTRLRIVAEAVDVVADIVSCRRVAKVFTLHAKLVTAIFAKPQGGFVSRTA